MVRIKSLNQSWTIRNKPNELIDATSNEHENEPQKTIHFQSAIPATIFPNLIARKRNEHPFFGDNEHKVKWVYYQDWEFSTLFSFDAEFLSHNFFILQFQALDTFCRIQFNGISLATTKNMYRIYEFSIPKELLKEKDNELILLFKAPGAVADETIAHYPIYQKEEIPWSCLSCLRKAQYSYGWDWGPILPDIGIWKPVTFIAYDLVRITGTGIDTSLSNSEAAPFSYNSAKINLKVFLDLPSGEIPEGITINYRVIEENTQRTVKEFKKSLAGYIIERVKYERERRFIEEAFMIEDPKIWWTRDLGDQPLYKLQIEISARDQVIESEAKRFGIREIELIRRKDRYGESFFFTINNISIFSKGANWIPALSFLQDPQYSTLEAVHLTAAKDANFNMLRIWGGGVYGMDSLYEFCDRNGILIWQDFQFAQGVFPNDESWKLNVAEEALNNTIRISGHPSLALWCGNNELEGGYRAREGTLNQLGIKKVNIKFFDLHIHPHDTQ